MQRDPYRIDTGTLLDWYLKNGVWLSRLRTYCRENGSEDGVGRRFGARDGSIHMRLWWMVRLQHQWLSHPCISGSATTSHKTLTVYDNNTPYQGGETTGSQLFNHQPTTSRSSFTRHGYGSHGLFSALWLHPERYLLLPCTVKRLRSASDSLVIVGLLVPTPSIKHLVPIHRWFSCFSLIIHFSINPTIQPWTCILSILTHGQGLLPEGYKLLIRVAYGYMVVYLAMP